MQQADDIVRGVCDGYVDAFEGSSEYRHVDNTSVRNKKYMIIVVCAYNTKNKNICITICILRMCIYICISIKY